ncbi:cadmium-translocating P-type ATPase [Rheinheimera riviphila]|uniref:Cadmium-translocating P-type ATPase n=1 Tax=Rheinheimera riviphila TaxID=1834037 RepID=A0A437QSL1_9GAMM|nr:heavy metal translocating P-type ATPase [Rheinheimera riviphila]RVU37482.1 cadmium-translocating P-type ATPase [Rheinheimera riviphila]
MLNRCFHCAEAVPEGSNFVLSFEGSARNFCCPGCVAVADTIISQGLADYYRFRTAPAAKASLVPEQLQNQTSYDNDEVLSDLSANIDGLQQIELSITGMSCAACAWLIEKQLRQHPAVGRVSVNSGTSRCVISWDPAQAKLSDLLQKISKLGYQASPFITDSEEHSYQSEMRAYLRRLAVSGIMSMQVMMLAFGLYFGDYTGIEQQYEGYLRWVSLLLTLPVMIYAAAPFSKSAWRALQSRQLNMDVPIVLALYYTFFASLYATISHSGEVYFESVCMFVFLLQLGKFFEFRARKQARDATSNLLKIMPVTAWLWDGEQATATSARRLQPGDLILVKAGETMPADGVVQSGSSSVDESMLTGEYRAVARQTGDPVLAGSVNHDGVLIVAVHKGLTQSRLGQIISLQQQTLHQKPQLLEKTDKIARFFVQRLLVVATGTFAVWYFYIDADRAFWVTLSVLVATCPCALSLATPTAITCALARLNRKGILIKNQQVLEFLPNLTKVFFDKTGTLTHGKFSVRQLDLPTSLLSKNHFSQSQLLDLIANIEAYSEHPIAKAFTPYRQSQLSLSAVTLQVGAGISAIWHYQQQALQVRIGNAAFCEVTADANWQVFCTIDGQHMASIALADEVRPEIAQVLPQLQTLGISFGILTGDSSKQADDIASQFGIETLHKSCTPEDKVQFIQQAVSAGDIVLMVGDGINDSPSFHAAHVSVALDSGTDLSKNQADVVLLHNDLSMLAELIAGAQLAKKVVRQNLLWAVGYNLVIIPLAVCGFVSPYVAVIGMSFSSLLVVSNSLRLLKA